MPVTLSEIQQHRDRLRREIVERECLLAAFNVLHAYATNGQAPPSMELGSLVAALSPASPALPMEEPTDLPPAPAALPEPEPEPPYIHPELKVSHLFRTNVQYVKWAIRRMTHDYSLRDIAALLEREGRRMRTSEISVVLTRMKRCGEVEEIEPGNGPKPAVFRKPGSATSPETQPADQVDNSETMTASAAAA